MVAEDALDGRQASLDASGDAARADCLARSAKGASAPTSPAAQRPARGNGVAARHHSPPLPPTQGDPKRPRTTPLRGDDIESTAGNGAQVAQDKGAIEVKQEACVVEVKEEVQKERNLTPVQEVVSGEGGRACGNGRREKSRPLEPCVRQTRSKARRVSSPVSECPGEANGMGDGSIDSGQRENRDGAMRAPAAEHFDRGSFGGGPLSAQNGMAPVAAPAPSDAGDFGHRLASPQ
ncbi:unnamed protein product [Ostreobium quekettii]|uniref:Uncharacterized protein n=1 Tax=Ostreobium quekettii TaxID=121088 RepID=A0A8S1JF10_9CHLO|nr:unnamed protein product [Ostreobium quekettii]